MDGDGRKMGKQSVSRRTTGQEKRSLETKIKDPPPILTGSASKLSRLNTVHHK